MSFRRERVKGGKRRMRNKQIAYKQVVSHIGWCISALARDAGISSAEMRAVVFREIHLSGGGPESQGSLQFKAKLAELKAQGKNLGDFEKMLL
jgi:hypothetical protein